MPVVGKSLILTPIWIKVWTSSKDISPTKISFINSYSFIFSSRPGTPSANMEQSNIEESKQRLKQLQNIIENLQLKNNENYAHKICEVLVENKMKNQTNYFGRLENFTPVIIEKVSNSDIGKIINVRIKDFNKNNLFGVKENIESVFAA